MIIERIKIILHMYVISNRLDQNLSDELVNDFEFTLRDLDEGLKKFKELLNETE
ncbi:MAG: hypothetical protein GF311_21535 [Candidatus Lokiarchaeota archaeon]|nr:hypothetical protein [Candidatus Lokiarchaeota archaeon]